MSDTLFIHEITPGYKTKARHGQHTVVRFISFQFQS